MYWLLTILSLTIMGCGNFTLKQAQTVDERCANESCLGGLESRQGGTVKQTPTPEPTPEPEPEEPKFALSIDKLDKPLTNDSNTVSWQVVSGEFESYSLYTDNDSDCSSPSETAILLKDTQKEITLTQLGYGPKYYICVVGITADGQEVPAENSPMEFKVSNVWVQKMSQTPPGRAGATSVWAHDKYFIWGGWDGSKEINDGWIYDPKKDTWTQMNSDGAPSGRYRHFAFAVGDYILIYGGQGGNGYAKTDYHKYHIPTDTWHRISTVDQLTPFRYASATHFTGDTGDEATKNRMIVWGGFNYNIGYATGKVYNFDTDTWSSMTNVGAPTNRSFVATMFTNGKLYIFGGGSTSGTGYSQTYTYDLKSDKWEILPSMGLAGRYATANVTIGDKWVIWGGGYTKFSSSAFYDNGAVFDPKDNSVQQLPTENAPTGRTSAAHVNIGSKLVIWGGQNSTSNITPVQDGAIYDLETHSWQTMSQDNAPPATYGVWAHAVSTGEAMIFWSGNKGQGKSYSREGGIYIP